MSSRLFIARIIPMLLLLLGGFGMAVADTGGGSPKKISLTKHKAFASSITGIGIGNGGNVFAASTICSERRIRITPSISLDPGVNTVSVSYTIAPTFGPIVNQPGDPGASFSADYDVPQVSAAGGMLVIIVRANFSDGSSAMFTTSGTGLQVWAKAAVTPVFSPSAICLGTPVSLTGQPTPTPSGGNGNSGAAITSFTVTPGSPFTGSGVSVPANTAGTTATFTPTTAGANSFTVSGNNAEGCTFNTTANLNVVAAPTGTVVASPNPACVGQQVSFSVSGSNAFSAVVAGATMPGSATLSPFVSNTTITPLTAPGGTFAVSYTLTGATGCTAVKTASYTVIALPANGPAVSLLAGTTLLGTGDARAASAPVNGVVTNANATAGTAGYTVCQNSTLTLSLSACELVGPISNDPTSTTTLVAPGYYIVTTSSGSVTVANGITSYPVPTTATGTSGYQVSCYNSLGCSSTAVASFTLTVLPTPVAPTLASAQGAGPSFSICAGNALSVSVVCATGSATVVQGAAVSASPAGVFTLPATATAGSYTYAATCQTASCTSVATNFTITVNPLPTNGPFVSAVYSTSTGSMTTTVNATTASSGSAISVCQNTPLLLSVTGCTASNPASTSTNPIVVLVPGGAIGQGASVSAAGGPGTGLFLVSTSAISTSATGPYVYTIVCVNSFGCSSTAIASLSVTVNPSPGLVSLTAVNGTPTDLAVAGGGTGAVAICQSNSPLIVNSNCLVTPGGSNTAGGSVMASSTAGVGVGVSTTATSGTFVSFSVSAATVGTFSYSFACVNSSGCPSPTPTVLTVTVNGSAVTPTSATARTVCENSGNVIFATGCGTDSATIVSRPTIEASSATITSNSLVIGSVMSGTFVYGIQCRTTAGCSSSTVSYTVVVNPRPDNANLTVVNGTIADRNIAGGQSGAVAICQGASLTVNTNCVISTASTTPTGSNSIGGTNAGATSGTTGTDGTTAAVGGGTSSTITPATLASFTITTSVTGTTNFTFACVNAFGCPSLSVTTLAVTVSASVAAPTFSGAQTACQNSGLLAVAATCSTPTGASLVITGAGGVASIADVNSTTATGTRSYTLQCVTPTCQSSTTTVTVIVRPLPANAGLTPSVGSPITAGGSGSIALCQNSPLSVTVTGCPTMTGTVGGTSGTANSSNSNFNVNPVAGSSVTASVNSFTVNTATVGTFSFTVNCTNEFLCTSPMPTTITVTVNSSVAAPTFAGTQTACQNSGLLTVAPTCSTPTGVSLVITGAGGVASIADINSTTATGTRSYTLQCVTPTCQSSTTTVTVTVFPLPAAPSLTAVTTGGTVLATVAALGSGSIAVCQNSSLTVITSCFISTSSTSGTGNVATGVSSSAVGSDGNVASTAIGVTSGSSTTQTAAYVISTTALGTTTFTIRCQDQTTGCLSASGTVLAVTVSASAATPTLAGTFTACLNAGLVSSTNTATSLNSALITGACPTGQTVEVSNASGVVDIATVLSTTATTASTGVSYTLTCILGQCRSTTTSSITKIVRPLPANAGLTVTNAASQTLATVPAAGSGTVAVCQGQSLTVITSCVINTSTASGSANVATGVSSGSVGQDGSVVAIANGVTSGSSSVTYAAFVISTSAVNTTTFTFRCQNEFGCTSPDATTLALTVSASVASPTLAGTFTACQNSGLVSSTNAANSLTSASLTAACSTAGSTLEILGASGVISMAQLLSTSATTSTSGLSYTLTCVLGPCRSLSSTTITKIVQPLPTPPSLTAVNAANGPVFVGSAQSGTVAICQQNGPLLVNTDCVLGTVANPGTGTNTIGGTSGTATAGATGTDGGTASVGGVIVPGGSSNTFASFTISTANTGTNSYTFTCVSPFGCTNPTTTTLTVTVNASVAAPATIASQTVCFNSGVLSVAASCTTAGSTAVFTGTGAGATASSGSPLSVSTTVAGLQTYTVFCRTATCQSNTITFTVLVADPLANAALAVTAAGQPTVPVAGGQSGAITVCEGTVISGLVTGCPTTSGTTGGGSASVTGSGMISVGGSSPVSSTSSMNTFTIPGSLTAGTYNYTVVCTSVTGSVTCTSPVKTSLVVTVIGAPVSPTGTFALGGFAGSGATTSAPLTTTTNITVCQNNPISLTIVGCNPTTPGSNNSVPGQTSGSAVLGGSQQINSSANNSFFTIPNTTAGVFQYTVVCTNPATGCNSLTPIIVNVTVNSTPDAPLLTGNIGSGQSITLCQGKSAIGTVTCPVNSFPSANTNALISSVVSTVSTNVLNFTATASTSQTGVASFSVICRSTTAGSCPSLPTTYTLTVNPVPANAGLTVSPATLGGVAGTSLVAAGGTGSMTVCVNSPISLTVTGCDTINTPSSSTAGSTSMSAGANFGGTQTTAGTTGVNVFTLPNTVTGTFVYTAVCTNMFGCTSPTVTTLNVTVQPRPVDPTVTPAQVVCEGLAGSIITIQTGCGTSPTSVTADVTTTGSLTGGLTSSNTYTISTANIPDAGVTGTLTIVCRNVSTSCVSATSSTVSVTINGAPNLASLTVATPVSAGGTAVAGAGTGAITVCSGSPIRINTDCLISTVSNSGVGNSLTAVNTGNTGNVGVVDGSTSGTGVGGGQVGGGSTSTFASFLLSTSIATTTTYTFVCVNAAGCRSLSVTTLAVTVNALPVTPMPTASAGVIPNLVVCETASGVLTITTGCGTSPSTVTALVTASSMLGGTRGGMVSGTNNYTISTANAGTGVTGTLTIICQNVSTSCVSAASSVVNVTINAAPSGPTGATIAAGNPAFATTSSLTICQGQPVSLTVDGCQIATGSAGGTTIGGNGSGFVFTGSGFTFTPTGPTTATAMVTDGNLQQGIYTFDVKCRNAITMCESLTGNESFTLVVTGQPSAVVASGFTPTCAGGAQVTGTLSCATGSLMAGYRLTSATGAFTTDNDGTILLPAVSGNYTVTAVCTTGGACLGAPLSFTVNNLISTPAPISVQTVQNAICLGQSTTLVAVCQTAGSSAIWFMAGSSTPLTGTAIGATSLIITPNQQGTFNYEAVCSDPNFACVSTRSTQIVLVVLPGVNSLPTISAQPNPTVAGQAVTLTGAGCVGTTIFYIQGTNTEVGRGTTGLVSVTVNPQVTTIYDAVCSNGQCTSNRTTGVQVFVTPCNFVATVTPSSAVICATGGSVQLTASGGVSYVWNNGQSTQQITVSAAGVYNVVVTSQQGCTAMASATITTGTAPSPTITGNTNIFAGQSTTLTAGGGGLYAWNGPGLAPNAGGAAQVVSQPGTYVVTVTSPTGCTASASVVVTNIALPPAPTVTPTAAVQPNATLQACVGQTVQLVASCPIGSTPRFKIGSTTNDATTQNVMSSTPTTLIYNVVCVAGGVEGPSTFAQVVFNGVPTVQILQTGVLCNNQPSSATLSATGASSYTWSTGATTQSIVVNSNAVGLYSVNGANGAGCVATASQMVSSVPCSGTVSVMMITNASIDCVNGNVTIAATGGNGNQIQYSIGGVQYSASNPVALDPAFQNNPANSFINLFVRQVNSTSTGFDVAGPFQYNFRAVCPVVTQPTQPTVVVPPSGSVCGAPTNTIGQPLVVTGVTDQNCLNGTFRVLVTGGNGSPLNFGMIVGLNNADPTNCTRRVDNGEQLMAINNPNSTITPFQVRVMQNGAFSNTFAFDFKAFCTGQSTTPPPSTTTTPPPSTTTAPPVTSVNPAGCGSPAGTVGQPLTIVNVDQINCAAGTFRILTTGGSGNTINYANIVGLSNADPYNCTRTLDNPDLRNQVNNPNSTIAPFNLRVVNVGGATSNTYSFNFKQACTGVARTARTEGSGTLDVTVLGNPTLGETVEVEVRGAEGQALQLRLVDGLGAAISEKSVEKAGATERQTISLGRSAGMYFLQVTTPTKSKTVKVVRQ